MRHDKFLTCWGCGMYFVFRLGALEYDAQRVRISEPTHCYACRQQRNLAKDGRDRGEPRLRARSSRRTGDC
jgi:hypothetical protein